MTTEAVVDEDGALQPALKQLGDAIHRLIGIQTRFTDGKLLAAESRYLQLRAAVAGEATNGGGAGTGSKSRPPCWVDAVDLSREIDDAVAKMQPGYYEGLPVTMARLRRLEARPWRPQDVKRVERITRDVGEWSAKIDALLDPPQRWTLPHPCPNEDCGAKYAYRWDAAGERVKGPALQIDAEKCRCGACHTVWPANKFEWLGVLLGCARPAGVLD